MANICGKPECNSSRVRASGSIFAFTLLAGCISAPGQQAEYRGQQVAQSHCSSCHAVKKAGESPAPEAPPFRTLSQNYRVTNLEDALAKGISIGHPAMPEFQFSSEDADALVLYLQSIQEHGPDRRAN